MTKDNGSNKNRASPQKVAKKKLEFKPLPLNGKTIYLDIKDVRQRRKLEETLKHLGAQVEKFLSKEINYVISSNTTTTLPNKKDGNNDRPDSPSFLSTPSPFNSGQGGSPNCLESSKQKTQTRAQAMVKLAQSQTQTTPVLQNAEKFGIKVIPVDAALKWVTRESSKLQSNTDTSKQQVVKKTTTGVKVKRLRQPLVKFEAVNLHYRPVQLEFDSWPHCNVDTPAGTCPFDGSTVGRAQKTEPEYRDRVVASQQGGEIDKDSVETPKDKTQSKGGQNEGSTSKMVGMQILTAGDLRRRQERKKQVEKKRGYCECCLIKYNDIDKHLRDEDHRKFARDKNNFIKLDQIIKTVNSPARFLKKVLHEHCMRKSVNNKKSESVVSGGDDVNNTNETTPQKHDKQIKESEPKQSQPIPCEDEADTKENILRRRIVTSRRLSSSFSSVRASVEKDADNNKHAVVPGVSSPRPSVQKTKPVVSPCSVIVKSLKNWPHKTKTGVQPAAKVKQKLIIKNMAIGSLQVASTSPDKILRGGDRAAKKQPKDNDSESGISKSVYFSSDYSDSSDTLSDSNTSSNEIIFNKRVRESKVMNNETESTKCEINPVRQLRTRKKDNSNNFYFNKVKLAKRQLTQKTKRANDKMNCLNKLCKIKTNNKEHSRKSLSQPKVRSKTKQSSSQPTVQSKSKSHLIPCKTSLSSPILKQLTADAPITSLPINMGEKCLSFAKHSGRKSRNSMEVQLHDMMIFNSLTEIWGKKKLSIHKKKESSISPGSCTEKTQSESNTSILNDGSNSAKTESEKNHGSIKIKKNRKSKNNHNVGYVEGQSCHNVKDNRLSSRKHRSTEQTETCLSLQTDTSTSPQKDFDSSSQTTSDVSNSGLTKVNKKRKHKALLIADGGENKQSNISSQESQVYSGIVRNARNSNEFILKKLKVTIEPLPSCSSFNISSRPSGTRQQSRSSSPYKSVQSGSLLTSATCSSNKSVFLQPPVSYSPNKSRSQLLSATCSPNKSKKIIDDCESQSPVFKKSPVFRPDPKKSQPSRTCRNITPAKPVIFNKEEMISPKSGISSTPRRRVRRQRKSQIQNFNHQTPSKSEKSNVLVVPTSTTIQNTTKNTCRSLETQLHEIEKSSVISSADKVLAQTLSHNSKIATDNYNKDDDVIIHPSKSEDSNIRDILNITDECCKTTTTKKRVKLNHSWRVLSDRSVSKLLESERDPAPFLGFEKKDTESCPMSGLSYEEQSEVDLDDSLSSEWIIRSTASDVTDFDDLMPDAYSSPNKRSNSSWFDACEEFLVVKLSSTPSASTGQRVHKKKLKRIGVENNKSKSQRNQNASCVSETSTLRSKIYKPSDNVLQSIDEDNETFQFYSPKRKKRCQNEMEQMVDEDIVFNFNSPQKNNQKHSSSCDNSSSSPPSDQPKTKNLRQTPVKSRPSKNSFRSPVKSPLFKNFRQSDNSLSSPPSDQPKTKNFRQTPVKSRPSKNSYRSPVKSPPFKNSRQSPVKSSPATKYKLLKNVADVKAKFNMNYFKKDSRAVKSPEHHSKKQSHLRKLMRLKDKAQVVVVPAPPKKSSS
ncbi:uncharacterized protein LOC126831661 [Patella vulgata]|uniref:uncharacterized protein LOC126831661 n=1 Tax=Patella vulgata TaxID=6465 RepID=UPI00218085F8|nr:uncharacterized protein LOC126831661 [Patella vulgata]